jgi:phosphoserine phosphatase
MKSIPNLPGILLVLLMSSGFLLSCNQPPKGSDGCAPLDRLNWSERNYELLNRMILDYGTGGKFYDPANPPYAVFDWDQTCAHFDVEEALMRYQLFHLHYKMTAVQFKSLLKDTINGVTRLAESSGNVRLSDINGDLLDDYRFLLENYRGFNGKISFEEIVKTPQYLDFIAKFLYLYDGYGATPGIGTEYGYLWEPYLFTGFTIEEVKSMAYEAIAYELANRIGRQTLQSPDGFPSRTGRVSSTFISGLRVFPEMQNLLSTLKCHGIDVYIVSASYKPVVEVFSGIGNFGYNIPPDHVIAMEFELDRGGKIMAEYKSGWVKTVRQGKVDAINRVIRSKPGYDHDPLFAAGDSDGDYEMATGFPGMKLTLLWNRSKGGDIGKLCKMAMESMNDPAPRHILQGRNENTGMARPSHESILFRETEPQLSPQ